MTEKSREIRLRRTAARRGMELRKSRRRDPKALDFGGYWLIDVTTSKSGQLVAGGEWGMSLDDVEAWLAR